MSYKRLENMMKKDDPYAAMNVSVSSSHSHKSSEDENKSDMDSIQAMDEMFGSDVKYKGRPVKGYYFLSFTVIMIFILTVVVII